MCINSRSSFAGRGIGTPSTASHAFTLASRWLTGQIPQMRAVICGISAKKRPSQNFSNPRNSTTLNCVSVTLPASSS